MWRGSLTWLLMLAALPAVADDRDGDALDRTAEETLGTDPATAEQFQTVVEQPPLSEAARTSPRYLPGKDFRKIEWAHAGGNRSLWRITFAGPPDLAETVFHLYVDADADRQTGRKGPAGGESTGVDYMISVVGETGTSTAYETDGRTRTGPPVAYAVAGNQLYVSADFDMAADAAGGKLRLYVLCHTMTEASQKKPWSQSSRPREVVGLRRTDRQKILRAIDHSENFQIEAAFGDQYLRRVEHAAETIRLGHDQLQLEGFSADEDTSDRWPHLVRRATLAKAWAAAPKAGEYHVGFMMYDDSSDSRVAVSVEGVMLGLAVANRDNNRTWLYWTRKAHRFSGGERVELAAVGPSGKHGICNLLFLPTRPQPRDVDYRVEHLSAATFVDRPGAVAVSWTTTWPCRTVFRYGKADDDWKEVAGPEQHTSLVHRVVLEGLSPEATYRGRATGTGRGGQPFQGEFRFTATPLVPPPTKAGVTQVPLAVHNPSNARLVRAPVTTGVPFPQGVLASPDHVRLVRGGSEIPAQVRLTGRWRDGSVKWLLLDFETDLHAAGTETVQLELGAEVRRAPVDSALRATADAAGAALDNGTIALRVDRAGRLTDLCRNGMPLAAGVCGTEAVGGDGRRYTPAPAEMVVEESGPLRAVVKVVSPLVDDKGRSPLRLEQRATLCRQRPVVWLEHTVMVTSEDKFFDLKDLTWRLPAASREQWKAALAGADPLPLDGELRQRFDDELLVGGKPQKGRLSGLATTAAGPAVFVRDCWQNYPKALRASAGGLEVGLFAGFEPGLYDAFPFEKQGHHLYYYLRDGVYRLRRGMAKTHQVALVLAGEAEATALAPSLARRPVVSSPAWYCRSRAFYDVAPRDAQRFAMYEAGIDKDLKAYTAACERQRDFGLMNFGDWYGERGVNWGNEEYDTQHAFFLEFIRSGNADAFFLGESHEQHNRDIDTIHHSDGGELDGAVYVHQMGHVGGYYDKPVPNTLGFAESGYSVSHAWAEGHFDHYFLSGDRRSYETGCAVADYFTRKELSRPYDFLSCRTPGWHLIMLAAAYAATNDPYYLNAAKVVIDRVLEAQDVEPRPLPDYQQPGRRPFQIGGWSRMLVPGHCTCTPRHRGNAGFMVAVLLSGMKYFHDVTGDERVKQAIILGAKNLLEETYSHEAKGFRYTSCPQTRFVPGASPLMMEGIARAYLWTKDETLGRALTESLPQGGRGGSYGKGFSMYYRMAPRLLYDLDAAGLRWEAARP